MLALRCPDCASRLDHAPHRRLHVCDGCGRRWLSRGEEHGGMRELPSIPVRPKVERRAVEPLYMMPVWSVGRARGEGADQLPPLYIPAVGWSRMSLLLAFARRLSQNPPEWEPWEDAPRRRLSPGDVHVEEAFELAEILSLALDPTLDLDAEGELAFGGVQLLDWPCVRRSSQVVELVAGRAASERLADSLLAVDSGGQTTEQRTGEPPSGEIR